MIVNRIKMQYKILAVIFSVTVLVTSFSLTTLAAPVAMPDGTLFDAEFYAANNPDVVSVYGSDNADFLYLHYVYFGQKEGRLPYAGATVIPNGGRTTSNNASLYYARSVFVGDSVMAGYRNYSAMQKSSPVSSSLFLAAASFSAAHALNVNDRLQPIYRGKKQPVWITISQMDVDRVFIMFGTNDLVVKDGASAAGDVLALVDKIREYNPGKEIHIISMSPVYAGVSKGALRNDVIWCYNYLLEWGAMQRSGVYYIDLYSHLVDQSGNLIPWYCSDQYVHQTYAAYSEVWDPLFTSYVLGE